MSSKNYTCSKLYDYINMSSLKIIFSGLLLLFTCVVLGQKEISKRKVKKYYFVTKEHDTVRCKKMEWNVLTNGKLRTLEYTDLDGKKIHLKGKNKVPNIITFYENGTFYDKLPSKINKPNGYYKYIRRSVNGKLRVYLRHQGEGTMFISDKGGNLVNTRKGFTKGPVGLHRFWIRFPDGSIYKVNKKKNMNDIIIPYLKKCENFLNTYKGNYSTDEDSFIKMIKLYNKSC